MSDEENDDVASSSSGVVGGATTTTTTTMTSTSSGVGGRGGGASSSSSGRVYVLSDPHAWIPARLLSIDGADATATVSVKKYDPEDEMSIGIELPKGSKSKRRGGASGTEKTEKVTVDLREYGPHGGSLPLRNCDENGRLREVEDMVDLPFLHEAAILYNLKSRHAKGLPYTRTGDIVVAVNPYQWIEGLYSQEKQDLYADKLIWNACSEENDPRRTVPPHVYETSSLAYRGLAVEGQDQSILVSGESGAGKTETVKILMAHLASVQEADNRTDVPSSSAPPPPKTELRSALSSSFRSSPIVERVLDSNPLLEAFGNAKTVRNDNSSRFGKYIRLQFDAEDPTHAAHGGKYIPSAVLAGSECEVYLLEKSRVVGHAPEERTYHVFYQLLAASEEAKEELWEGLVDADAESFAYVGYSDTDVIEGKTDAERWDLTVEALSIVGVTGDKLKLLVRSICVVLQLGNLIVEEDPNDAEKSVVTSTEELEDLANLMGIADPRDVERALTLRTMTAPRGEVFRVPLNAEKARDARDAFAKEIYDAAFRWLVRTINDATCAERNYEGSDEEEEEGPSSSSRGGGERKKGMTGETKKRSRKKKKKKYGIIGLLDIFGFESFQVNRFEQLCINYANEKLQQKFTVDVFRSVQSEYEFEGIDLGDVDFSDNADVLDLVEGRMGLIAVLNEECVRPKGSDVAFVSKIRAVNRDADCLVFEKSYYDHEFGVRHYAGLVVYDATEFVTKNTDALPTDLVECASKCDNALISEGLGGGGTAEGRRGGGGAAAAGTTTGKKPKKRPPAAAAAAAARRPPPGRKPPQAAPSSFGAGGGHGSLSRSRSTGTLVSHTVWTKFRSQLASLMSNLGETRSRYVRCIKPNPDKRPKILVHGPTVEQLRCAGVVAAVTISRSAFPNRLEHGETLERFACLWGKGFFRAASSSGGGVGNVVVDEDATDETLRLDAERLLSAVLKPMESSSKDGTKTKAYVCGATRCYFRAGSLEYLEARRLDALGSWAIDIQRIVRGYFPRKRHAASRGASVRVQASVRRWMTRKRYREIRYACVLLQCWARCASSRGRVETLRKRRGATSIQTRWRSAVARSDFRRHRNGAVRIQAIARGSIQRPIYRRLRAEAIENAKLENQIKVLQRKFEEAEEKRLEAERKAEEEAAKAKTAAAVRRDDGGGEKEAEEGGKVERAEASEGGGGIATPPPATAATAGQLTVQQQTLMDESGKMLEYLRKEVFKLRASNTQLRADFDLLKENNQRLMDANASAGASFAALNQHAKQLNKTNAKLVSELAEAKGSVSKLNLVQVELKEELKMKTATYVAEVHSRIQYQNALTSIVDMIQDRCRDAGLVEDVLNVSDECEADYMGGVGGGETMEDDDSMYDEDDGFSPRGDDDRPHLENETSFTSRFRSFFGGS